MRIIKTTTAMQALSLHWRREGARVGFVPTMGYLHAGHLSLMREARKRVGRRGVVVVSIYVNPAQFGPNEDLSRYPRDLARDTRLCRKAGVDVLFVPSDAEMYPRSTETGFSTYVVEESLTSVLEGAARPTHFRGVTTVVAKLFNLVQPQVAVFGAKDYQQATVVRRMVRDLNFPVEIVVAPTVREPDGLALSSRNKYLTAAQRAQAPILFHALEMARELVAQRRRPWRAADLHRILAAEVQGCSQARLDYLAFFEPETLQPVAQVTSKTHLALAVFFGKTRLIDNGRLG